MPAAHLYSGLVWEDATEGCAAYLAEKDAHTAVLFVHGFYGHPTKTWGDFVAAADNDGRFDAADLFFWGYSSRSEVGQTANRLHRLLARLAEGDPSLECGPPVEHHLLRALNRQPGRPYGRVVLAAHSLGGLVARKVLLHAATLNPPPDWMQRVRMTLFAPAQCGSVNLANVTKLTESWWALVPVLRDVVSPPLRALAAGSPELLQLRADVRAAVGARKAGALPAEPLVPSRLVWGKEDAVVVNDVLDGDPVAIEEDPANGNGFLNHGAVCKPGGIYLNALEHVYAAF